MTDNQMNSLLKRSGGPVPIKQTIFDKVALTRQSNDQYLNLTSRMTPLRVTVGLEDVELGRTRSSSPAPQKTRSSSPAPVIIEHYMLNNYLDDEEELVDLDIEDLKSTFDDEQEDLEINPEILDQFINYKEEFSMYNAKVRRLKIKPFTLKDENCLFNYIFSFRLKSFLPFYLNFLINVKNMDDFPPYLGKDQKTYVLLQSITKRLLVSPRLLDVVNRFKLIKGVEVQGPADVLNSLMELVNGVCKKCNTLWFMFDLCVLVFAPTKIARLTALASMIRYAHSEIVINIVKSLIEFVTDKARGLSRPHDIIDSIITVVKKSRVFSSKQQDKPDLNWLEEEDDEVTFEKPVIKLGSNSSGHVVCEELGAAVEEDEKEEFIPDLGKHILEEKEDIPDLGRNVDDWEESTPLDTSILQEPVATNPFAEDVVLNPFVDDITQQGPDDLSLGSPLVKKLLELTAAFLGSSLFTNMDEGYKIMCTNIKQKIFESLTSLSFVKILSEFIFMLVDNIKRFLVTRSPMDLLGRPKDLVWLADVKEFNIEMDKVKKCKFFVPDLLLASVESLITVGADLINNGRFTTLMPPYQSLLASRSLLLATKDGSRPFPYCVTIVGDSGIGKTSLVEEMTSFPLTSIGMKPSDNVNNVLYYQMGSKFQDYQGSPSVVVFNDFGSTKEEFTELVFVDVLQTMIDSAPCKVNRASIEDKANSQIFPELVIVTGNADTFTCVKSTNAEKLPRRINQTVRAKWSEFFKGKCLKMGLSPAEYFKANTEECLSRRDVMVISVGSNQSRGSVVNFVPIKFQEFTRWHDVLVFLQKDFKEHQIREKEVVKSKLEKALCSQGLRLPHPPDSVCPCVMETQGVSVLDSRGNVQPLGLRPKENKFITIKENVKLGFGTFWLNVLSLGMSFWLWSTYKAVRFVDKYVERKKGLRASLSTPSSVPWEFLPVGYTSGEYDALYKIDFVDMTEEERRRPIPDTIPISVLNQDLSWSDSDLEAEMYIRRKYEEGKKTVRPFIRYKARKYSYPIVADYDHVEQQWLQYVDSFISPALHIFNRSDFGLYKNWSLYILIPSVAAMCVDPTGPTKMILDLVSLKVVSLVLIYKQRLVMRPNLVNTVCSILSLVTYGYRIGWYIFGFIPIFSSMGHPFIGVFVTVLQCHFFNVKWKAEKYLVSKGLSGYLPNVLRAHPEFIVGAVIGIYGLWTVVANFRDTVRVVEAVSEVQGTIHGKGSSLPKEESDFNLPTVTTKTTQFRYGARQARLEGGISRSGKDGREVRMRFIFINSSIIACPHHFLRNAPGVAYNVVDIEDGDVITLTFNGKEFPVIYNSGIEMKIKGKDVSFMFVNVDGVVGDTRLFKEGTPIPQDLVFEDNRVHVNDLAKNTFSVHHMNISSAPAFSKGGSCGTGAYTDDCRLVYMHLAYSEQTHTSLGCTITVEDLEIFKASRKPIMQGVIHLHNRDVMDKQYLPGIETLSPGTARNADISWVDHDLHVVGHFPFYGRAKQSGRATVLEPIFSSFLPEKYVQSNAGHAKINSKGEYPSIYARRVMACKSKPIDIDWDVMQLVVDTMECHVEEKPFGKISWNTVFSGEPINCFLNGRDTSKSVGKFLRSKGLTNQNVVKQLDEENYEMHPIFKLALEEREETLLSDNLYYHFTNLTVKDFMIPMSKSEAGGGRLFGIHDLVDNSLGKRYYGNFISSYLDNPLVYNCFAAINATGSNWKEFMDYLVYGKAGDPVITKFFDFDYSDFDASHDIMKFIGIYIMIHQADALNHNSDPEFRLMLENIQVCMNIGFLDIEGVVLFTKKMLDSGKFDTVIINSVINKTIIRYAFYKACKDLSKPFPSPEQVRAGLRFGTCGDDVVGGVCDEFDFFNSLVFANQGKKLAYSITSGDKVTPLGVFKPIDKVTFLKRSFVKTDFGVLAPLELKSIYKSLCYQLDSSVSDEIRNIGALTAAQHEMFHHGEEKFREFSQILKDQVLVVYPSLKIYSYQELMDKFLSGQYTTWEVVSA